MLELWFAAKILWCAVRENRIVLSGFECYEASDENGLSTKQCMTYCWLYIQDRPVAPGNPEPLLEEPFLDLNPECLEVRY